MRLLALVAGALNLGSWFVAPRGCDGSRGRAEGTRARLLLRGFQLFVLHDDELIFANLVPMALFMGLHRLAGDRVHHLLAQAVTGGFVDLTEGNPLGGRDRGVQGDRRRDERQLQIALPMRSRGHDLLHPTNLAQRLTWLSGLVF